MMTSEEWDKILKSLQETKKVLTDDLERIEFYISCIENKKNNEVNENGK